MGTQQDPPVCLHCQRFPLKNLKCLPLGPHLTFSTALCTELNLPTQSPGFTTISLGKAALEVFDSLISFTQRTSVHSQTQCIGSKNLPNIYLGSNLPPNSPYRYTQKSESSHPNHGQPAASNGPPNSNRVPYHKDPAKTRPSTQHISPMLYPGLDTTSFPKKRRLC